MLCICPNETMHNKDRVHLIHYASRHRHNRRSDSAGILQPQCSVEKNDVEAEITLHTLRHTRGQYMETRTMWHIIAVQYMRGHVHGPMQSTPHGGPGHGRK